MTIKLGIVVPTYNEKDNISDLLNLIKENIAKLDVKTTVLVMDDSSPDGTADIVGQLQTELNGKNFEIKLKVREGKQGLATAYTQGFAIIQPDVDYLMSMDADLSHQPKYIKNFLAKAKEGFDLIIGSRYIQGGGVVDWGVVRKLISKMGSLYSKTILGVKINDFTGGYNMYKSELLNKKFLDGVKARGYLFQIEMKYRLAKQGVKFAENPIIFPDRTKGQSKISKKIIIEAFLGVWKLKFGKYKSD